MVDRLPRRSSRVRALTFEKGLAAMTTQSDTARKQISRRQFTLAGLLSFMLAVGVYCSMLVSLRPLFDRDSDRNKSELLAILVSIPTTWCILLWLYRRWRLPQARNVHLAGPVIAISLMLLVGVIGALVYLAGFCFSIKPRPVEFHSIVQGVFAAMMCACGISAIVSLPAATLMLLYLMLRRAIGPVGDGK
jgi:hypothetical protein